MGEKEKMHNKDKQTTTESVSQVKPLFEWIAPGRPFKKRTKNFYLISIFIALPLIIASMLFHDPIGIVIIAFLFVAFVLNSVPPKNFHYKITNGGITIEDHFFLWQELYDFYFKKRFDTIEVLHIRTRAFLPGEITLTLGESNKETIKNILIKYIPYRESIPPTFVDKAAHWLTKNFPLETEKKKPVSSQKVAS